MKAEKVTIYRRSEMMGNVVKVEARSVDVERVAYAQYRDAIKLQFIPKGARKPRGLVETYRSSLLVLEGWGHPDPDAIFDESKAETGTDGVTTVRGRYAAFDEGWARDFDAKIRAHLEATGARVLWDTRGEAIA